VSAAGLAAAREAARNNFVFILSIAHQERWLVLQDQSSVNFETGHNAALNHEWTRMNTNGNRGWGRVYDTLSRSPKGVAGWKFENQTLPVLIRVHWCSFVVPFCIVPV
jgi:hypothetical protein